MAKKAIWGVGIVLFAVFLLPKAVWDIQKKANPAILGSTIEQNVEKSELPHIKAAPELASAVPPPALLAKSAFALDPASSTILFTHNFDQELPIASLTKLMTAIVVVESVDLNSAVTVKKSATGVIGNSMGLVAGEKIRVADLLSGMLISSSNDAALTLADFVAGDSEKFVNLMNDRASKLNLAQTRFANPVGYDSQDNYSSTRDLSLLVLEFMKHSALNEIAETREKVVFSIDGKRQHKLTTTNKLLLADTRVVGIKTGFTSQAQGSLIIRAKDGHRDVVTIVLDSPNREGDSAALLKWIFDVYKW
ncbi:MAG: D-alanyl-D-alanine carboxypeptidase [Candidatus Doudnabacteria bacterium]|nr:D-alanyl-D-alanine carboxypeptidase [Candidatus Doudnabacteria bacterium]